MSQVIVVATNGWVFIGEPDEPSAPGVYALKNAGVLRVWGTTRGLGQICLSGATKDTIIDPVGALEVSTVVAVMAIQPSITVDIPWVR